VPEALKLLPLVPADGLPSEPNTERPYKITVISTTPGVKPLAVGVVGESLQLQSWCWPCAAAITAAVITVIRSMWLEQWAPVPISSPACCRASVCEVEAVVMLGVGWGGCLYGTA
jgi:hypothetical protein